MSDIDDLNLADLTAAQIADWPREGETGSFEIEKGGSGRRFFRITRGGRSIVVMLYALDRPENGDFAPITDFLTAHAVPVPRIEARDDARRILWIEDLGENDLWTLRYQDWRSVRRPFYEAALRAVNKIHCLTEAHILEQNANSLPHFQDPFDEQLYRWEQDYFFDRFASRFSAASPDEIRAVRESAEMAQLIDGLVALPRTLVHRDFQSQNVMLPNGEPRLIDYQGMRFGLPEYDLGSLIFDPYVPFTEGERNELAAFYHSLTDGDDFATFENRLLRCSAQRLMQALGAYGFLGVDKGQKTFLKHIPTALETLRWIAIERDILPGLAPVLKLNENRVA